MEEQDFISKKDLLQLKRISYGQLYRWKRENLIPEEWFIKKSSFTGQETFFPREKILKRIEDILAWKDQYSLEDLVQIVSPEQTSQEFDSLEISSLTCLNPEIITMFERELKKNHFTFMDLTFIALLSKIQNTQNTDEEILLEMLNSIKNWLPKLNNSAYRFVICQKTHDTFYLLAKHDAQVFFDGAARDISTFDLDELAGLLNAELKDKLKQN